jgi:predicted DCC family thiol-disulfide oxidoreductase YuxK
VTGPSGGPATAPSPGVGRRGPSARSGGPALLVLYDERCRFCLRCRDWLAGQPTYVPLDLLPAGSPRARHLAPHLPLGEEIVVLGSDGSAWVGDDALLVCLWATRRHRALALRLAARPHLSRAVVRGLSSGRRLLGRVDAGEDEVCEDEVCQPTRGQ